MDHEVQSLDESLVTGSLIEWAFARYGANPIYNHSRFILVVERPNRFCPGPLSRRRLGRAYATVLGPAMRLASSAVSSAVFVPFTNLILGRDGSVIFSIFLVLSPVAAAVIDSVQSGQRGPQRVYKDMSICSECVVLFVDEAGSGLRSTTPMESF